MIWKKSECKSIEAKIVQLEEEKIKMLEKHDKTKQLTNEIIGHAMERIEMFQKNEEFSKSIVIHAILW